MSAKFAICAMLIMYDISSSNTDCLYIIVFDLQFYNRHLWCTRLSAITSLVARERQGVTGVRRACSRIHMRYQGSEQHVHSTNTRTLVQRGFLALQETAVIVFHNNSSDYCLQIHSPSCLEETKEKRCYLLN